MVIKGLFWFIIIKGEGEGEGEGEGSRAGGIMIRRPGDMEIVVKTNMRGGDGEVLNQCVVPQEMLINARLFSKLSLKHGCSIGPHKHEGEVEYYYILSGTGIVTEDDGERAVRKGDVVITGWGASHAIRNDGEDPLELLAVIITE